MLEIPLDNKPEQLFSVVLNGQSYDCRVVLNSRSSMWGISFSQSNNTIVSGIALAGGIDILFQYNLDIENAFVVNLNNTDLDPTSDNLGTVAKLFILTDLELSGG